MGFIQSKKKPAISDRFKAFYSFFCDREGRILIDRNRTPIKSDQLREKINRPDIILFSLSDSLQRVKKSF